ncbi:MMPL family transporter [Mycobacterium uberis]|uniref:MMPL family transporter n=1 Tax=Mycobacterium uberis TaxID=2162698 RepID=UPI000E307451
MITVTSIAMIFVILFLFYRSSITVTALLLIVGVDLIAVRAVATLLAHSGAVDLTIFVISIIMSLVIVADTDYKTFLLGRYQEAR